VRLTALRLTAGARLFKVAAVRRVV